MSQSSPQIYDFGNFRLDASKRLLLRDGEVVMLKSKDFDLLSVLVEHAGKVLGKDDLLKLVWPDSFVEEGNLSVHIFALRRALGETPEDHNFIVTIPGRGYSFVAEVRQTTGNGNAEDQSPRNSVSSELNPRLEPVGGAVPLHSRFYIERKTDTDFQAAVERGDSIVLVKGARQVGKTSLLARSLQRARQDGARVALTDFQMLNASHLASVESLLRMLAKSLADQLELPGSPDQLWDEDLGPSMNFARYMRREVLAQNIPSLVWGLDEVDRLFTCAFASEIFGLFRSWHNARSLDPAGPWRRLTLAMAYATEAHLFITDVHQSPFNVGTRLTLEDFSLDQVAELNLRYGSLLGEPEIERFFMLVGGHPYLVRCGLHEMTLQEKSLEALEVEADRDEGPFGDHLRRLLISLQQDAALCDVVRGLLQGQPCPTEESFYRLRSAGVVVGDSARNARLRCRLYETYLKRHFL
ncbi:MAG: helix-turn-helix transcriptional regulator [Acidobacteria bacterium]|nr:helix-turn-helix transcriptional regulator [Acidobacteriota bacterium]